MAFERLGNGHYRYDDGTGDKEYYEVECGGGGNCLFLSLAWLFEKHGIADLTHAELRAAASEKLVAWQGILPGHIPNYAVPMPGDLAEAQVFANDGEYGTLACIVAIVEQQFADGVDIEVHVLGPAPGDTVVYRCPLAHDAPPAHRIHLYYLSYIHYRALIRAADVNTVPASKVVANFGGGPAIGSDDPPRKIHGSLKLTDSAESENNTFDVAAGCRLEIHQIDVGQGEAALILLWDADDTIVKSVLIDAARTAKPVTDYFDELIKAGRFRPIDIFFASHYDNDHIGGAPDILDNPRYTDTNVLLYDYGKPAKDEASEATNYLNMNCAANRRLPSLSDTVLETPEGLSISCFARCGLVAHQEADWAGEGSGPYSIVGEMNLTPSEFDPETGEMGQGYYPQSNDRSLALLIRFGNFTFFTAGDLSGVFEATAAQVIEHVCGFVTVMKAGHHGAGESTTAETLSRLVPRFVMISCGFDNSFGHPAKPLIKRLEELAGKKACNYGITSKVAGLDEVSGEKFPPEKPGGNGAEEVGTMLIEVTDSDANKWPVRFTVTTTNGKGEFICEDRRAIEKPHISKHEPNVGRKRAHQTEEHKAARHEERRRRKLEQFNSAKNYFRARLESKVGTEKLEELDKNPDFATSLKNAVDNQLKTNPDEEFWEDSFIIKKFIKTWSK